MPLDEETIAAPVVKTCVRITGNLRPTVSIEMQNKLGDLRIKTDRQLEQLRLRILDELQRQVPPCSLHKEFLNGITVSTTVRDVVAIVAEKGFEQREEDASV